MFPKIFGLVWLTLAVSVLQTDAGFSQFQSDALKIHNDLRKIHHAPELSLDEELCKEAEDHAKQWIDSFIKTGSFKQPPRAEENANDNIWTRVAFSSSRVTASMVIGPWANQGKSHDFAKNTFNPKTAHFTQMVWKSTDSLGAAIVTVGTGKGKNKRYVTVAITRYAPAGNVNGEEEFTENVLPA